MPDGGVTELVTWIGAEIGGEIGAAAIMYSTEIATALQVTAAVYTLRDQQRKAENRARDAYNASLRDRYVMVRGATEQRQLVMGRQRVSGPIGFVRSFGSVSEHLALMVILAAHEVDAIESVYFDDEPTTIDGIGNVIGIRRTDQFSIAAATGTFTISTTPKADSLYAWAQYGTDIVPLTITAASGTSVSVSGARPSQTGLVTITSQPYPCPYVGSTDTDLDIWITLDGAGFGTGPLTIDAAPGSLHASYYADSRGSMFGYARATGQVPLASLDAFMTTTGLTAGSTVTINAPAYAGASIAVTWRDAAKQVASRARVRMYRGAAGQAADAGFVSALPGVWTSAHTATGLAYLASELDYDADAFPGGIPNHSAITRGALCFDPRDGATRWTENPALLIRWYATHPLGGRLPESSIDDASIITAANVCDESVTYTVGGKDYTRARYTAGHTVKCGTRPADVLHDLAQAMGGRWCMVDGKLKVKAGSYTSPVAAIDESWLSDGGAIQIQPACARRDLANAVTGTFADEQQSYRVVNFPKVTAPAYIAADGAELPIDVPMPAVTFSGQAQYIAACQLRYARQGLTVKLTCNMRAYVLEPFDVVALTLSRYGWASKTFEVLSTDWTLDGGIEVSMKEIDPSIWAMDAGFTAVDPAPNTRLPSAFGLPAIDGLGLLNDSSTIITNPDGSKSGAVLASWTAATDPRITQSGTIELRWGLMSDAVELWRSTTCAGNVTSVLLIPVQQGSTYGVQARARAGFTAGAWTDVATVVASTASTFDGQIATGNIVADAVSEFYLSTGSSASVFTDPLSNVELASITYTAVVDCDAILTAYGFVDQTCNTAQWSTSAGILDYASSGAYLPKTVCRNRNTADQYATGSLAMEEVFSMTAGTTKTFRLYANSGGFPAAGPQTGCDAYAYSPALSLKIRKR